MSREEIINNLKGHIIRDLYRENLKPDEISEDMTLFSEDGLGLDSLDAVELATIIEKDYGVVVEDEKSAKAIFYSLASLSDYIMQNRQK